MNPDLSLHETRVIGCLVEKEITTPDQYPLSLNSLTNACNQKSNRDPVLDLDEAAVQQIVDQLIKKRQPRAEISASVLQHRVRHAEILAPGTRHHLRTLPARPANPGRIAQPR